MNKEWSKVSAGHYRHSSGIEIIKRGASAIGRNGYWLAGWAIVKDGRELDRRSTLTKAKQEAFTA